MIFLLGPSKGLTTMLLLAVLSCRPIPSKQTSDVKDGGFSGGGGGYITKEGNPWFMGDKKVRYCVRVEDGKASIKVDSAREQIKAAIQDWISTIQSLTPEPAKLTNSPNGNLNLALEFTDVTKDDVTCQQGVDLEFVVGSLPEYLRPAAEGFPYPLIALSRMGVRSSNVGTIWLDSDLEPNQKPYTYSPSFWSFESTFYNSILHEFGHVFGIDDLDTGLMGWNFVAERVKNANPEFNRSAFRRYTSKEFLQFDWFNSNVPICGYVWAFEQVLLRLVPNYQAPNSNNEVKNSTEFRSLCIRPEGGSELSGHPNYQDKNFIISISTEEGEVAQAIYRIGKIPGQSRRHYFSIDGFFDQLQTNNRRHAFVSISNYDLVARPTSNASTGDVFRITTYTPSPEDTIHSVQIGGSDTLGARLSVELIRGTEKIIEAMQVQVDPLHPLTKSAYGLQ